MTSSKTKILLEREKCDDFYGERDSVEFAKQRRCDARHREEE